MKFAAICAIILLLVITPLANAAFPNGYLYRANVSILNGTYQFPINITNAVGTSNGSELFLQGNCSSTNCTELLFTINSTTLVPNWTETNISGTNKGKVWVNISDLANNATLSVYYGKISPQRNDTADGLKTFWFFDTFDGSALASKWTTTTLGAGGSVTITGGQAVLTAAGAGNAVNIKGNVVFTPPYTFHAKATLVGADHAYFGMWTTGASNNPTADVLWAGFRGSAAAVYCVQSAGAGQSVASCSTATTYTSYFNITRNSSGNQIFYINNSVVNNTPVTFTTAGTQAQFSAFQVSNFKVDWVFITNVTPSNPTLSAWSAQEECSIGCIPQLINPADDSTVTAAFPPMTNTTTFNWSAWTGYQNHIIVAKDSNFNIISYEAVVSENYTTAPLDEASYYWRVRYYNSTTGTYYGWSDTFNFTLSASQTTSGKTGIQGVVYELIDGVITPISGATVYISNSTNTWSNTQVVGSNGYYLFDNLTNSTTYYINAKAQGYDNGAVEYVTTISGAWARKDLLLIRCISGQDCFGTQIYVKFVTTDFFGNLYSGLSVSVYKGSAVTTTYTGTTGTDGAITFLLTKDQSYRLVFSGTGSGKPIATTTITITPGESTLFYVFVSTLTPDRWWTNTSYQEVDVIRTQVNTSTVGTNAFVNVSYNDSLAQTTSWVIYLNQTNHTNSSAPQIVIQSASGTGNASVGFTLSSGFQGESYLVNIEATHTTFGAIKRSYGVQFYGTKDGSLNFIPAPVMALIAIMILVFVGSFFDSTNYAQGAGLVCVIGWIELGLGMFSYVNMYISVGIGLGIASVIAIIANMNERNRKETVG